MLVWTNSINICIFDGNYVFVITTKKTFPKNVFSEAIIQGFTPSSLLAVVRAEKKAISDGKWHFQAIATSIPTLQKINGKSAKIWFSPHDKLPLSRHTQRRGRGYWIHQPTQRGAASARIHHTKLIFVFVRDDCKPIRINEYLNTN